jgi:hypothetical protein
MKKITAIIAMFALMVGSANAFEVGVTGGYQNTEDRWSGGLTASQKFDRFEGLVGWDRASSDDRYTVAGGVDLFDTGPVTWKGVGGVHYLYNDEVDNGWAYSFGAGASMPIYNQFSLVGDVSYQRAIESRVEAFDGVVSTIGFRYGF